jgi:uncharacterized protein YyaL (SSP411 family)
MLYDNSQLARVYLHAWQVTGNDFFRAITEEILDYVVREMTDPAGGFYSTQDADSEGEEGKFFVWTPSEIQEGLGSDADEFMAAYGVTPGGNFEGKNILEFVGDLEQRPALAEARKRLYDVREKRVHPGRDEKVLTSWNGLMLAAFSPRQRGFWPVTTIEKWPSATRISCCKNSGRRMVVCCGRGKLVLSVSWKDPAEEQARPSSTATWRTTATSSRACWSCTRPPLMPSGLLLLKNWLRSC